MSPERSADLPLLEITALHTQFSGEEGVIRAVDGVDLTLRQGEVLGLVGESGCGKTITALSIMRLIAPPGRIVSGRILFEGRDLLSLTDAEMVALRGDRLSMIFQQPKVCLNPVIAIGAQIAELFRRHRAMPAKQAREEAIALLEKVGIPAAPAKAQAYPHELSGGQAQRVMIAMALALRPSVLIADEPTTALDVTIQAQILDLLRELCRELGTALLLVTHDLGVIAEIADRVAVMYAGQIVEEAPVIALFDAPRHPYTQGLLSSMPVLGRRQHRLDAIPGSVPSAARLPAACRFAPRCRARIRHALTRCQTEAPPLFGIGTLHHSRCWLSADAGDA